MFFRSEDIRQVSPFISCYTVKLLMERLSKASHLTLPPYFFGLPLSPASLVVRVRPSHYPLPQASGNRAEGEGLETGVMGSTPDSLQHEQGHCCS